MEESQDIENDDDILINIKIKHVICDPDPESSCFKFDSGSLHSS